MKKTLILDANQRSALAVTRSLGQHGVPTFTAEETPSALAGASKYSVQYFEYPSPRLHPKQFIEVLSKLVKDHQIDILLPMTELTTELLLIHKASFPNTAIPAPSLKTVESLSNKCALMKQAVSLDIPIPRTVYANNANDLPSDFKDVSFPTVLKPGKSWVNHEQQWRRATVRFADNAAAAKNIIKTDWAFDTHPFMLQETISGHGAGVFAIYNQGKPLAFFAHRRLREKPPSGGVSVLSESTRVDPLLLKHTRALLDKANWHGIAMVEFKISEDGTPYLMEINTRFWGSLQLAIDAGVDFPWLLYQLAVDEQPAPVTDFKTGVRLRWLLGDVDNLYLTLRNTHNSLSEKLTAIRHFLTPSPFKSRHEINRLNDMSPAWFELKKYVKDLRG